MAEPHATQTHALYRFYSEKGQLLYVGITNNPGNRFSQHQADKPWWHDVAGISVEKFDTRPDALAAEARAIHVENPLHNIKRPTVGKRAPNAPKRPTRELVWRCNVCGQPVTNGDGYIHVDLTKAHKYDADYKALRNRVSAKDPAGWRSWEGEDLEALMDLKPVPWEIHHLACDPHPEHYCYWFDVARARTHAHLLDWTAHLLEKDWLNATSWSTLIRTAAGVDA